MCLFWVDHSSSELCSRVCTHTGHNQYMLNEKCLPDLLTPRSPLVACWRMLWIQCYPVFRMSMEWTLTPQGSEHWRIKGVNITKWNGGGRLLYALPAESFLSFWYELPLQQNVGCKQMLYVKDSHRSVVGWVSGLAAGVGDVARLSAACGVG